MTIMDNHNHAMLLADEADAAKRAGDAERAILLVRAAYDAEKAAAMALRDQLNAEPTRSVLFRSAASLAMEAHLHREAEQMIAHGLSGEPPEDIADELRDLLAEVDVSRHLALRGISLGASEVQLTLAGAAIGPGFAQSSEVVRRIETFRSLARRTLERRLQYSFRDAGRPSRQVSDLLDTYISVPRAASFALTLKIGTSQEAIAELDVGPPVISDIMDGIDLLNARKLIELQRHISDDSYFENFVALTRKLAPDGSRVTLVGLTTQLNGAERCVRLDRSVTEWATPLSHLSREEEGEFAEVTGLLLVADGAQQQQGTIQVIDENGTRHTVSVPRGQMADIVRPLFDSEVVVRGRRSTGGRLQMESIDSAGDM